MSKKNSANKTLLKYQSSIKSAIDFVSEHYMEKIYIEDICKHCFLSKTYFSTLFKRYTGYSFVSYLNKIRIEKSIELLKHSNRAITDICLDVGFNELSYFIKIFRSEIGISPRRFREEYHCREFLHFGRYNSISELSRSHSFS